MEIQVSNLHRRKGHMPAGRAVRQSKRLWSRLVYHFESPKRTEASEALWRFVLQQGLVIEKSPDNPSDDIINFRTISKLSYGIRENEIASNGGKL